MYIYSENSPPSPSQARELGRKDLCSAQMDTNCFHFTVESVTSDGPRTAVDVVRAAFRILDYKLSQFMDARYVWTPGFGEFKIVGV